MTQTIAVHIGIGCTKAAPSVSPEHRRPSTNVQTGLHVPGLTGWIFCADQKISMAEWQMERRHLCVAVKAHVSQCKLPAQGLLYFMSTHVFV